jgi:hypothetical protein
MPAVVRAAVLPDGSMDMHRFYCHRRAGLSKRRVTVRLCRPAIEKGAVGQASALKQDDSERFRSSPRTGSAIPGTIPRTKRASRAQFLGMIPVTVANEDMPASHIGRPLKGGAS